MSDLVARDRRALSFGAVAEEYDAARPDYPDALFARLAGVIPGRRILEVGAGTGKATRGLLAQGLDVTALEPDPGMAAVLAARTGLDPVVTGFETWVPKAAYDGLVSAQAWHWTDPASRCDRAAATLVPGGVLAVFWNVDAWQEHPAFGALSNVYERHGVPADHRPLETYHSHESATDHWPGNELAAHPAFEDVTRTDDAREVEYDAAGLTAYWRTTSHHRVLLDAGTRESVERELFDVLAAQPGGVVRVSRHTVCYTAWRR